MADLRVLVPFSCPHCWRKTLLVVLSNLFQMHVVVFVLLHCLLGWFYWVPEEISR